MQIIYNSTYLLKHYKEIWCDYKTYQKMDDGRKMKLNENKARVYMLFGFVSVLKR